MAAKSEFYTSYVDAIKALSSERKKKLLDTIKRGKVGILMQTECYAVKSDTISDIIGKSSPQNSSHFATLYKGWPLDSQANPLRVKAAFKLIHGTISTSGGAIVPCSVIDAHGLEVQISKESFDQAEPPKKYGRQEEMAEHPEAQKTPTNRVPKAQLNPEGSVGTKRRRSTARIIPEESEKDASMSVGESDDDDNDDDDENDELGGDEFEEEESDDQADKRVTHQEFDEFAHRVKTQLFVEGENRVNIIEHEKLLNAYTKLQAKCDKLKKEADEAKATAEMLRLELEGWGRFQKVLDESRPKKG